MKAKIGTRAPNKARARALGLSHSPNLSHPAASHSFIIKQSWQHFTQWMQKLKQEHQLMEPQPQLKLPWWIPCESRNWSESPNQNQSHSLSHRPNLCHPISSHNSLLVKWYPMKAKKGWRARIKARFGAIAPIKATPMDPIWKPKLKQEPRTMPEPES